MVDAELGRELADTRKWMARRKLAGLDEESKLVDHLAVGGGGAAEIDGERWLGHGIYCTSVLDRCTA